LNSRHVQSIHHCHRHHRHHAPRDDNYPLRAYIAPPELSKTDDETGMGFMYQYELQLPPNLVGDWILLQWHYFTANSCIYPGYTSYPYPSEWGTLTTGTSLCQDIPSDGRGLPGKACNTNNILIHCTHVMFIHFHLSSSSFSSSSSSSSS
jgi:hypothetical protein